MIIGLSNWIETLFLERVLSSHFNAFSEHLIMAFDIYKIVWFVWYWVCSHIIGQLLTKFRSKRFTLWDKERIFWLAKNTNKYIKTVYAMPNHRARTKRFVNSHILYRILRRIYVSVNKQQKLTLRRFLVLFPSSSVWTRETTNLKINFQFVSFANDHDISVISLFFARIANRFSLRSVQSISTQVLSFSDFTLTWR